MKYDQKTLKSVCENLDDIFFKYPWILQHNLVPWYGSEIDSEDMKILHSYPSILDIEKFHPRLKKHFLKRNLNARKNSLNFQISKPSPEKERRLLDIEVNYAIQLSKIDEMYLTEKEKKYIKNITLKKLLSVDGYNAVTAS